MKAQEQEALLNALGARIRNHMHRHQILAWSDVRARLEGNASTLKSLRAMEATGGAPSHHAARGFRGTLRI